MIRLAVELPQGRIAVKIVTILSVLIVLSSCVGKYGETIIELPKPIEDKDKIFRGGYGLITIRYTPPPPPVFELNNYSESIEFNKIRTEFGIPDKATIVDFMVDLTVYNPMVTQKSGNAKFDSYVVNAIRTWGYTRYGRGVIKIKIDTPKRKVIVAPRNIKLAESEPGKPPPYVGKVRELVKIFGFTIVEGNL